MAVEQSCYRKLLKKGAEDGSGRPTKVLRKAAEDGCGGRLLIDNGY